MQKLTLLNDDDESKKMFDRMMTKKNCLEKQATFTPS